jgi:hypothetical protein
MAGEYSLYEESNSSRQSFATDIRLGHVSRVIADQHLCEVRPFWGRGDGGDGLIRCQWLDTDSEGGYIPRVGTMGLVFMVGGEAFFFGAMRPLNTDGSATTKDDANLGIPIEGNKTMATKSGARITVKTNGVIEIVSNTQLTRVYYPTTGQIYEKAKRKDQQYDGGRFSWSTIDDLGHTLQSAEYRRDPTRTAILVEERGYVDDTVIKRTMIGPAVPKKAGIPLAFYEHTISATGEVNLRIHPLPGTPGGFTANIKNTGAFKIQVGIDGAEQFLLDVAETGDLAMAINKIAELIISKAGAVEVKNKIGSISMSEAGEITAKNQMASVLMDAKGAVTIKAPGGEVTISVSGEMKFTAIQKVVVEAKTGIDIKSIGGPVNVEAVGGPLNVKGKTINLDGGTGASQGVLCNPLTISPFTGTPLAPFSQTVKVSA